MFWTLVLLNLASANDGPSPRLHAEAAGQTVTLKLELHEAGEPGLGEELEILRTDPTPEETAVKGRAYESSDADYETDYCKNWELDSGLDWTCDESPELCEDCDGDGVNECARGCETWQGFDLTLACVEPGSTSYEVREVANTWGVAQASIEVEDEGRDCAMEMADDDDFVPEGDGCLGNCATAPAPRGGQLLLGLLMGLAGWFSLRRD